MENFNPSAETIEDTIEEYQQKLDAARYAINDLILTRQKLVTERDDGTNKYIIQIKEAMERLFPEAPADFNINLEEKNELINKNLQNDK